MAYDSAANAELYGPEATAETLLSEQNSSSHSSGALSLQTPALQCWIQPDAQRMGRHTCRANLQPAAPWAASRACTRR